MTLYYLSTPFSKRPALNIAYIDACQQASFLMLNDIPVISPIAHAFGISTHGGIDHLDHEFWMRQCQPLMEKCDGMILCQLDGWQESVGIEMERDWFLAARRPVIQMKPFTVPERLEKVTA